MPKKLTKAVDIKTPFTMEEQNMILRYLIGDEVKTQAAATEAFFRVQESQDCSVDWKDPFQGFMGVLLVPICMRKPHSAMAYYDELLPQFLARGFKIKEEEEEEEEDFPVTSNNTHPVPMSDFYGEDA